MKFSKRCLESLNNSDYFIDRAITRYFKFLIIARLFPEVFVVPTLDIDLVWHAHMTRFIQISTLIHIALDIITLLAIMFLEDFSIMTTEVSKLESTKATI